MEDHNREQHRLHGKELRSKANSTEHATTAGRRVTEAENPGATGATATAKANRWANDDTQRVNWETKVETITTSAATRDASS